MKMISVSCVANVSAEKAWEKMRDLSKPHFYVPGVTGAVIISTQKEGIGTSRRIFSSRAPLIETVTAWNEGRGFTLKLHSDDGDGIPPLFKKASFQYALEPLSKYQTRLTNCMNFEMKWGKLGHLLSGLIMRSMRQMQENIITAQKEYYETGKSQKKS
ncbi:SRPBCC family protein [Microbulbifer spongiae]|uniref:SRPBCC family protein n=1 Tax=Microbulbifer spongiae TaxID=2944933 RepID=A0ABY9E7N0_9GAMM|nr:SRPBCC family protein [Microbulbifer sp. MI-G]WKD49020.1 SRPBCC family protein [Microbulbifer sp. MI-G]